MHLGHQVGGLVQEPSRDAADQVRGLRRQRLPGIRHNRNPTGLLCTLPTHDGQVWADCRTKAPAFAVDIASSHRSRSPENPISTPQTSPAHTAPGRAPPGPPRGPPRHAPPRPHRGAGGAPPPLAPPATMCVLMPTRNEAGNVAPLLDRLGPALAGMDGEVPGGEPVAVQL